MVHIYTPKSGHVTQGHTYIVVKTYIIVNLTVMIASKKKGLK